MFVLFYFNNNHLRLHQNYNYYYYYKNLVLHNRRCKTADKIVADMLAVEILAVYNSAFDTLTKPVPQINQIQNLSLIPQNNFVSFEHAVAVVFVALPDWV
jgi:hypothetical protein